MAYECFTINESLLNRPHIDSWIPEPQDIIINPNFKESISIPISQFYSNSKIFAKLDHFMISPKRSYNNSGEKQLKPHLVHYLNYFIKYYDWDNELLILYSKIKYLIDCEPLYTEEAFLYDIQKYFLSNTILYKIHRLNEDNYITDLSFKRKKDESLQYSNKHGKIMMAMSFIMNMVIPITTHFIYVKGITDVNNFILRVYDLIFMVFEVDVDIINKLDESITDSLEKNRKSHIELWNMQSIRGRSLTTQSNDTLVQLILNIMPKYTYNQNLVHYNSVLVKDNNKHQITDIAFEYKFIPLSSSKRDMDNNNEMDRFESHLPKQEENLYTQNIVNCKYTMGNIEAMFGPFDPDEVDFYIKNIDIMSGIQKEMIFYLFYKYFGDPKSINAINKEEYVKLLLAARKLLSSSGLVILPKILSGRPLRFIVRKNLCKKDYERIIESEEYLILISKYKNRKIEKDIQSLIATIIGSDFEFLEYNNPELNGQKIEMIPEFINAEILMFMNLID